MVPWWGRGCASQSWTVGLPLSRYACCARLGHQTLLQNRHTQTQVRISPFLPRLAPPGLSCQLSSPCLLIRETRQQVKRGQSPGRLRQQGRALLAHTHSASQALAKQTRSCDQLQQALLRYQIPPSCLRPGLTGVEEFSVLSSRLTGSPLHCQLWDRIRRIKFIVRRMIKRDFTTARCCQKLKVNKLMVNVFSAVCYFKLKIKMNVSTVPCVHMLLLTSAHSCCLRRLIPRLITVSFQSKSVRSI